MGDATRIVAITFVDMYSRSQEPEETSMTAHLTLVTPNLKSAQSRIRVAGRTASYALASTWRRPKSRGWSKPRRTIVRATAMPPWSCWPTGTAYVRRNWSTFVGIKPRLWKFLRTLPESRVALEPQTGSDWRGSGALGFQGDPHEERSL